MELHVKDAKGMPNSVYNSDQTDPSLAVWQLRRPNIFGFTVSHCITMITPVFQIDTKTIQPNNAQRSISLQSLNVNKTEMQR